VEKWVCFSQFDKNNKFKEIFSLFSKLTDVEALVYVMAKEKNSFDRIKIEFGWGG
jgi:hypothetical protein